MDAIPDCGECGNPYLAIRTDIYKDGRQFVYCDCCGSLGDLKLWKRANALAIQNLSTELPVQ